MVASTNKSTINNWVSGDWNQYLEGINNPINQKAKTYYYTGEYRVEIATVGNSHAQAHSMLNHAIYLYATLRGIALNGKDNCSYHHPKIFAIQPDLSFYMEDNANIIPWETEIIDLSQYPLPDLVIEVSDSSLSDDLGKKRLLYEDLGISEYWIADVNSLQVTAFKIENRGSRRIKESEILSGLKIQTLTEALQRSKNINDTKVSSWLLQEFQK